MLTDRAVATSPVVVTGDVITEDEFNELMYWRDQHTAGAMRIGQIALERDRYFLERGYLTDDGRRISRTQILTRIGGVCGRARTTVLLYMQNAEFYEHKDATKYGALAFCHLNFARSQETRWKLVLDYALKRPTITEAELFAQFPPVISSSDPYSESGTLESDDLEQLDSDCDVSHVEPAAPPRVRALSCASDFLEACARVRAEFDDAIDLIDDAGTRYDLLCLRDEVHAAENSVRKALPALTRALNREL